jgi:hypothetical protein
VGTTLSAALAYSVAGASNASIMSALNDLIWAVVVISSFPLAMFIMAGSFGFWRAGMITNRLFGAGVLVVILGVLGGTTWISGGVWAPDGIYHRLILPAFVIAWFVVAQRVVNRTPATRAAW